MRVKTVAAITLGAAVVTACASQLDVARRLQPMGNAFQTALADGYLVLAEGEQKDGNNWRSKVLAKRAIGAKKGEEQPPETTDRYQMVSEKELALSQARRRLIAAYMTGTKLEAPNLAANAQVAYDCWLYAAASNDEIDANACQARFESAMSAITAQSDRVAALRAEAEELKAHNATFEHDFSRFALAGVAEQETLPRPRPELSSPTTAPARTNQPDNLKAPRGSVAPRQTLKAPAPSTDRGSVTITTQRKGDGTLFGAPREEFRVYFEIGSTALSFEAQRVIERIAAAVVNGEVTSMRIEGHADRLGPAGVNTVISRKRAETVNRAIADKVDTPLPKREVVAFGEERPEVATPDNVANARNRRVEVKFF